MASLENSEKILGIAKNYIIPFIVFITGLAVAWSTLDSSVKSNAMEIDRLEVQCSETSSTINIVLQRLASIDARLEYLVKEVDSLSGVH